LETKVFSSLFKQNDLSAKDSVNQTIPVGRIPLLIEVN
jgi:hypothetical protein